METFLTALALRLKLPGFGPGALKGKDGALHELTRPEHWYHRGAANLAFDQTPVAEAGVDDMLAAGLDRLEESLRRVLPPEQWKRAATVYCKGGRFEPEDLGRQGDVLAVRWTKPVQIIHDANVPIQRHHFQFPRYLAGTLRHLNVLQKRLPSPRQICGCVCWSSSC